MTRYGMIPKHLFLAAFSAVLAALVGVMPIMAETMYVSDMLIVSVREDPSDDAPALGYLTSETRVEILEPSPDQAFVKVETPEGMVGWVKNKFLNAQTPKSAVIRSLEAQVQNLEDKIVLLQHASQGEPQDANSAYEARISALQESIQKEQRQVSTLENELSQAKDQYQDLLDKQNRPPDSSADLLALKKKNEELVRELLQAQQQQTQPSLLAGNMKWFLAGAAVLLLGFIIGRSFHRKRNYRY